MKYNQGGLMQIKLEVQEINYILSILAQRPYQESAELIHKIQSQGNSLEQSNESE